MPTGKIIAFYGQQPPLIPQKPIVNFYCDKMNIILPYAKYEMDTAQALVLNSFQPIGLIVIGNLFIKASR